MKALINPSQAKDDPIKLHLGLLLSLSNISDGKIVKTVWCEFAATQTFNCFEFNGVAPRAGSEVEQSLCNFVAAYFQFNVPAGKTSSFTGVDADASGNLYTQLTY